MIPDNIKEYMNLAIATQRVHEWTPEKTMDTMRVISDVKDNQEVSDLLEQCLIEDVIKTRNMTKLDVFKSIAPYAERFFDDDWNDHVTMTHEFGWVYQRNLKTVALRYLDII